MLGDTVDQFAQRLQVSRRCMFYWLKYGHRFKPVEGDAWAWALYQACLKLRCTT